MNDEPSTILELSFSCDSLPKMDLTSKSDPQVHILTPNPSLPTDWIRRGSTEVVGNNNNPTFATPYVTDYFFERVQQLKFCVVDVDGPTKSEAIGEATLSLAQLVAAPGASLTLPLFLPSDAKKKKQRGSITVSAEEMSEYNSTIELSFSGVKLANMDGFFGKSDPFVVVKRISEAGVGTLVVKSPVIKNDLNPNWPILRSTIGRLCGGDHDRPLVLEVYDWDSDGSHDLIGTTKQTSLRAWMNGTKEFPLTRVSKKGKVKATGTLRLDTTPRITKNYSFVDYLRGGAEVSLSVAIDFTASNGKPSLAKSLHYFNPLTPNQYHRAITQVGAVLAPYDHDGAIAAFGFGAKVGGKVNHCFPLNGNQAAPEIAKGVAGVLQAYSKTLQEVTLFGPTLFHKVIHAAAVRAQKEAKANPMAYSILLVLTDGVLNDLDETVQTIKSASKLPLSIIIIGVGDADFSAMEKLDDQISGRDIVQFVPFNKHRGDAERLAADVLAEVPEQLVEYMCGAGIEPTLQTSAPPPYMGD